MKIFLDAILQVLDNEMCWCQDHEKVYNMDPQYVKGFISGLVQAKTLLKKVYTRIIEDEGNW